MSKSKSSLPDDLIVSILARVSRLYYPTLSLVSKSFRSFIASPELYQTRSLLAHTESCLYVCLRYSPHSNPRWFTLCRKPKKKESSDSHLLLLVPIPIINSPPPVESSNIVSVDSYLYAISSQEPIEVAPCSNVSFLDCRTHTWLEAPSMQLAHTHSDELDGKLYLPRSCENPDSFDCIEEVFSEKTQTWKPQPLKKPTLGFLDLQGKIYMTCDIKSGKKGMALKLKDLTWEVVGLGGSKAWAYVCMIDNIVYLYKPSGEFLWFYFHNENDEADARKLKGLEGLPKFDSDSTVRLVNYGGKLMVLWDQNVLASEYEEKMIWCAEISLDKRNNEEIWGKVEWFDSVLTVPKAYEFVCATAATV